MITTDDRITRIWDICRDAYLRHTGRRLSFPAGTDPRKTYQWRYLVTLERKFNEWDFDNDTCAAFIDVAVRYAAERRLLQKGLAIFAQKNLVAECYRRLREQDNRNDDTQRTLLRAKRWFDGQLVSSGWDARKCHRDIAAVKLLLRRDGVGAYPNIVRWHQAGYLPECYLAISRTCGMAIARLDHADRSALPSDVKLFLVRTTLLKDQRIVATVKNTMQDEWRKPC